MWKLLAHHLVYSKCSINFSHDDDDVVDDGGGGKDDSFRENLISAIFGG